MAGYYGVFIIESATLEHEQAGNLDGQHLMQILTLMGVQCEYYFIRTKLELEEIISVFYDSNLRYLHIACHGSQKTVDLTFNKLPYKEFADIVGPVMSQRRLFLSACNLGRLTFAKHLIPSRNCLSVVGIPGEPNIPQSASFWSTFYFIMNNRNPKGINHITMLEVLTELSKLYRNKLAYFSRLPKKNSKHKNSIRSNTINGGTQGKEKILETN